MTKDQWMTDFYKLDWYKINNLNEMKFIHGPCMFEFMIDASDHQLLYDAQLKGFKIVETSIEFETLIDTMDLTTLNIRPSTNKDVDAILEITQECYIHHDKFYNRFRNDSFFSLEQAWLYYKSSVLNKINEESVLTVVAEDEQGICAYYILAKLDGSGTIDKYKGIIAGVKRRAKGRNLHIEMQKKLTEIIGKPYITINRTQLGNYRVINNHIQEKRQLSKIEHICYYLKN